MDSSKKGRRRWQLRAPDGTLINDLIRDAAARDKRLTAADIADIVSEDLPEPIMPQRVTRVRLRLRKEGKLPGSPYPGPHRSTGYGR